MSFVFCVHQLYNLSIIDLINICSMKLFKISTLSTQTAIILSALIIGASIFVTTWVFFGGDGNRQKLFIQSPTQNRPTPTNPMTSEQIKKIQEERAAAMQKRTAPATTTQDQ